MVLAKPRHIWGPKLRFFLNIVPRFGGPKTIITNNGTQFTSVCLKILWEIWYQDLLHPGTSHKQWTGWACHVWYFPKGPKPRGFSISSICGKWVDSAGTLVSHYTIGLQGINGLLSFSGSNVGRGIWSSFPNFKRATEKERGWSPDWKLGSLNRWPVSGVAVLSQSQCSIPCIFCGDMVLEDSSGGSHKVYPLWGKGHF